MFEQSKYLKAHILTLEDQIRWQRLQIEALQAKLFRACKLDHEDAQPKKAMKFDKATSSLVPKSDEEIHSEQMAILDLLNANEHPYNQDKK